ncbi:MAG: hypothetical protein ACKVQA_00270 [Burkholderiales bacterium]
MGTPDSSATYTKEFALKALQKHGCRPGLKYFFHIPMVCRYRPSTQAGHAGTYLCGIN